MQEATSAVVYLISSAWSASTGGNRGKPPVLILLAEEVMESKTSKVSKPGSNTLAMMGYKISTFARVADKYPLVSVSLKPCCV